MPGAKTWPIPDRRLPGGQRRVMKNQKVMMLMLATVIVSAAGGVTSVSAVQLKKLQNDGKELAILDPREEGTYGSGHLLHAVNIPLSKLELNVDSLVPRLSTRIVLADGGEGTAERAAVRLQELGYTNVAVLKGGYRAWKKAGYEIFSGMSVPGKAFGEWIAVHYNTPQITAEDLHRKIVNGENVLILDSRPANEYADMNIPGSINVPGSELVYRFPELGVKPETLVVVNCAGRTRSIIGAQSLINAGVKNKVVALNGGTMAWQTSGFELEHGSKRDAPKPSEQHFQQALEAAQKVADRYGVKTIDAQTLATFKADKDRTVYLIDLRTPEEYRAGHRPDSSYGWGVQLVQGMDKYAATRHARIVLVDNYLVRALMTASWLVQADWPETYVLADPFRGVELTSGDYKPVSLGLSKQTLPAIDAAKLREMLNTNSATVVDAADSSSYAKGHIPGAWFVIRARLGESINRMPLSENLVVTGNNATLAALTAQDLARLTGKSVSVLAGGNAAWQKAGLPMKSGMERPGTQVDDIFVQPFLWGQLDPASAEFRKAADDYLAWELQLPAQLERAKETDFKLVK
ncbi:MAG: thiosulfate sulfurtransferase [Terriglobia bacterium]|nr:MAG: thiosulfate sulfurtransferase [Terriglobia bacterium]